MLSASEVSETVMQLEVKVEQLIEVKKKAHNKQLYGIDFSKPNIAMLFQFRTFNFCSCVPKQ